MSYFKYEELVQKALLEVAKEVLRDVAGHGLSGNHHFYIRFRTDHPKTKIPSYLRQRHPEEIMIVIQYQFWNLKVGKDYFSVDLSFNSVQETLVIPYDAMTAFIDPSVKFALQFTPSFSDGTPIKSIADTDGGKPPDGENGKIINFDSFRKK